MNIALLHLSDIHLKKESDPILGRVEAIARAFKGCCGAIQPELVMIILSGDLAFSGQRAEYDLASIFLDKLVKLLADQGMTSTKVIIVPGNHDCDFAARGQKVRECVIDDILLRGNEVISDEVLEQCCFVQKNFRDFLSGKTDLFFPETFSDELLSIYKHSIGNYHIKVSAYNTAWMSQLKEKPGERHFPLHRYVEKRSDHAANLSISVLHHPYNWFDPGDGREMRDHLMTNTDIILTGHEHVAAKLKLSTFDGDSTEWVEGAVLQSSDDECKSGFNVILIETEAEQHQISMLEWISEGRYSVVSSTQWIPFQRARKRSRSGFSIDNRFMDQLLDPGATFTHPRKSDLTIDDLFVYPNLRRLSAKKASVGEDVLQSSNVLSGWSNGKKVLISGPEKSGKTTLLRRFFRSFAELGFVPLLIDGDRFRGSKEQQILKVVEETFQEEYSREDLERFKQEDNSQKVVLIDGLDRCKLNTDHRSRVMKHLLTMFGSVVVTGNELFDIEELLANVDSEPVFRDFEHCSMIEFGHHLRHQLIERWCSLGREDTIDEGELIQTVGIYEQTINIIIGRNLVPSNPLFLLTILQTIETSTPLNLNHSLFGHYYEVLITQALFKVLVKNDIMDAYFTYLTELAFFMFKGSFRDLRKESFAEFHAQYCKEYKISPSLDEMLTNLMRSNLLDEDQSRYYFKYQYTYYYFVARHLANNLSDPGIRELVKKMCQRVFTDEFANIIMFVTHLSKDPYVINELLTNSRAIFQEQEPIKLETDVDAFNNLVETVPKLVLEDRDVRAEREQRLKEVDTFDQEIAKRDEPEQATGSGRIDEDISRLDAIARLNLAFKSIDILGQVVKKYYGSMKGPEKRKMVEETYFLGLRSLNLFFEMIEQNKENIVREVSSVIQKREEKNAEKKIQKGEKVHELSQEDIEKSARRLLFNLLLLVAFAFIKKISDAIGTDKLTETFEEVADIHPWNSVLLIDASIKMDFIPGFPYQDVEELSKQVENNPMCMTLLRNLAVNHLYMFKTSIANKQRICNLLGIPMSYQRSITATTTRKK